MFICRHACHITATSVNIQSSMKSWWLALTPHFPWDALLGYSLNILNFLQGGYGGMVLFGSWMHGKTIERETPFYFFSVTRGEFCGIF